MPNEASTSRDLRRLPLPDFNGVPAQRTPPLTQLSNWYLQTQLQKFKHNVRGNDLSDSDGYLMKTLMANYSHQQLADMVAHIKTHPHKAQAKLLDGDPIKGKEHYISCIACHEADGSGNEELESPAVRGLSDTYIVNQLIKFKNGTRGSGRPIWQAHATLRPSLARRTSHEGCSSLYPIT